jgi:predicted membrane chloride channel (bestrophin family)
MTAFLSAMLVMIAMAVVVGMVAAWWVLIPVMATDFAVTGAVLVVVLSLLNDGDGG